MEQFKTVPAYFMAIERFLQLLRFSNNNIKPIDTLSRRHFINSSDVWVKLYLNVI